MAIQILLDWFSLLECETFKIIKYFLLSVNVSISEQLSNNCHQTILS